MEKPLFGEDMSKSSIASRRKLAASLIDQATSATPVSHWTQILAKALAGGVGGYEEASANKSEAERTKKISEMLAGVSDVTPLQRAAVESGDADLGDVAGWQAKAQLAGNDAYGKQLVVGTGPDGKPIFLQASGSGGVKAIEDYSPANPTSYVQTPQAAIPSAKYGGAPAAAESGIPSIQKDYAAPAAQREQGTEQARAAVKLDTVQTNVDLADKVLLQLENHPGLPYATGISLEHAQGYLDPRKWQDVADFNALKEQAGAKAFLGAYDAMRGSGQISNIEDLKGTQAFARFQAAQSPEALKGAIQDMREWLHRNLTNAVKHAQGNFGSSAAAPPPPPAGGGAGGVEPSFEAAKALDPRLTPDVWARMPPEAKNAWMNSQ